MAGITSVDLARAVGGNLESASPDVLRAMLKTFAGALMGRGGRDLRRSVWPGEPGAGEPP